MAIATFRIRSLQQKHKGIPDDWREQACHMRQVGQEGTEPSPRTMDGQKTTGT